MKTYRFEQTGNEIKVSQLISELLECGISLNSTSTLVRWNHHILGVVFDTISMYRKYCGYEKRNLETLVPKYLP